MQTQSHLQNFWKNNLCFLSIFFAFPPGNAKAQSRPNVMAILTDDMGCSDIGWFYSEINTPNIDRLAENGLRFTQFYNTPHCRPARASLMTGLYPHQAGMGGWLHLPSLKNRANPKMFTYSFFPSSSSNWFIFSLQE